MGKFVYFTSAEKRQANEVDLPSFLLDRGEKLIMAGRDYRLASDHSITVRGPMWYDHAARKGGRAISFVQQFYDKTYPEAVTMLLGRDGQGIIPIVKKEPESREPKPFALPEAYLNMRRLYAYLTTHRRIDRDVVTEFVREKLLYQSKICPYGYRKSADGRMEPDPEAAAVVQLIFQLAAEGINATAITRELFRRSIPSPGQYKAAHGNHTHDISRCHGIWSTSTILRILEDERYTGVYVIGKRAVLEVGGTRSRLIL